MVSGPARCSFALRPACSRTRVLPGLYTEGFERFITSTLASVATGWSDSCRVGFPDSPTGVPRLSTAHFSSLLDYIYGARILRDGNILSWAHDTTLRIWNTQSGECLMTLPGGRMGVLGAMQTEDGNILSWSWDKRPVYGTVTTVSVFVFFRDMPRQVVRSVFLVLRVSTTTESSHDETATGAITGEIQWIHTNAYHSQCHAVYWTVAMWQNQPPAISWSVFGSLKWTFFLRDDPDSAMRKRRPPLLQILGIVPSLALVGSVSLRASVG
jgi:WD40 repeat protein